MKSKSKTTKELTRLVKHMTYQITALSVMILVLGSLLFFQSQTLSKVSQNNAELIQAHNSVVSDVDSFYEQFVELQKSYDQTRSALELILLALSNNETELIVTAREVGQEPSPPLDADLDFRAIYFGEKNTRY